jgi:hypothetical protein
MLGRNTEPEVPVRERFGILARFRLPIHSEVS